MLSKPLTDEEILDLKIIAWWTHFGNGYPHDDVEREIQFNEIISKNPHAVEEWDNIWEPQPRTYQ